MITLWYVLFRTPDLTDLHFFVCTPFSIHQHGDLSPATDTTRGAASASPTYSMRSVAAPRLSILDRSDLEIDLPERIFETRPHGGQAMRGAVLR